MKQVVFLYLPWKTVIITMSIEVLDPYHETGGEDKGDWKCPEYDAWMVGDDIPKSTMFINSNWVLG